MSPSCAASLRVSTPSLGGGSSVDKNLITVDLLNDRTERLERVVFGLSEFCDLLLDWRQKLISRADSGSASLPRLAAEEPIPLEEATAA